MPKRKIKRKTKRKPKNKIHKRPKNTKKRGGATTTSNNIYINDFYHDILKRIASGVSDDQLINDLKLYLEKLNNINSYISEELMLEGKKLLKRLHTHAPRQTGGGSNEDLDNLEYMSILGFFGLTSLFIIYNYMNRPRSHPFQRENALVDPNAPETSDVNLSHHNYIAEEPH